MTPQKDFKDLSTLGRIQGMTCSLLFPGRRELSRLKTSNGKIWKVLSNQTVCHPHGCRGSVVRDPVRQGPLWACASPTITLTPEGSSPKPCPHWLIPLSSKKVTCWKRSRVLRPHHVALRTSINRIFLVTTSSSTSRSNFAEQALDSPPTGSGRETDPLSGPTFQRRNLVPINSFFCSI